MFFFSKEIFNSQLISLKHSASDETLPISVQNILFITPVNAMCIEE